MDLSVSRKFLRNYRLLKLFNKYLRREPIDIWPIDGVTKDKSLIRTRYAGFDYMIPDYETMIGELGEWMRAHKEIYPHYDI